jgi:hypothetical protein
MFNLDGSYVETLYGGMADTSMLAHVTSVSLRGRTLAVADVTEETVSEYRGFVNHVETVHAPSPLTDNAGATVFGSEIALSGDGLIAEHWIERGGADRGDVHWDENLPLVRLWHRESGSFTAKGWLRRSEGVLTGLMNRGRLVAEADTIWFGRRMDGRILGFSVDGGTRGAVRVVEPPIWFRGEVPVEFVDSNGGVLGAAAPYHLIDFSVAPSGRFFVLQTESFPKLPRTTPELRVFREAGVEYRSRKILVVLDRWGELLRAFRLDPYDPWEITVTETVMVLLAVDELGQRRVLLYDNPMAIDQMAIEERGSCFATGIVALSFADVERHRP